MIKAVKYKTEFAKKHCAAGHPLSFSDVSIGSVKDLLVHKHPSGSMIPTRQDIEVKRMIEAGKIRNNPLVDHITVGAYTEDYYSFLCCMPELIRENRLSMRLCTGEEMSYT